MQLNYVKFSKELYFAVREYSFEFLIIIALEANFETYYKTSVEINAILKYLLPWESLFVFRNN